MLCMPVPSGFVGVGGLDISHMQPRSGGVYSTDMRLSISMYSNAFARNARGQPRFVDLVPFEVLLQQRRQNSASPRLNGASSLSGRTFRNLAMKRRPERKAVEVIVRVQKSAVRQIALQPVRFRVGKRERVVRGHEK